MVIKDKSIFFSIIASLLLHIVVAVALFYMPEKTGELPREPVFMDLQDMPELKQAEESKKPARPSDIRVRVKRETAPKMKSRDSDSAPPKASSSSSSAITGGARQKGRRSKTYSPSDLSPSEKNAMQRKSSDTLPDSSTAGLLKPKASGIPLPGREQLFPDAGKMAKLEERYRRSFNEEIEEGATKFLNTDDILFGSFLRRFENAVYGVWRYPEEAAIKGIQGVTPVKITFNRQGKIIKVKMLDSSGSKILDNEVIRTLDLIGPMGSFPRGYNKEEFNLIAFFRYTSTSRTLR